MEFLFLVSGLIIGVGGTYMVWKSATSTVMTKDQFLELDKEKCLVEERYSILKENHGKLQELLIERECRELDMREHIAKSESEVKNLNDKLIMERSRQQELHQKYADQFETLAQRMLKQNVSQLTDVNQEKLGHILDPLQEKIQSFEKRVEANHLEHTMGSRILQQEVQRLAKLNQQISQDAKNLTQALKGNNKTQGIWGEIVLERILDQSGLQRGREYFTQGSGLKLRNEQGVHQKPDVIISLPEQKHLIIDAKVSLKAYEAYINSSDETQQVSNLKRHRDSIKGHIDNLSGKYYQKLEQLNTLDFVIMFLPVEGSLITVMDHDTQDLLSYGWERNVILVTPTTLIATLKTIASLWRNEKQHRNAIQIAKEGSKMYDKLCTAMSDLQKLGKSIQQTENNYRLSMQKLCDGKGNLLGQAKKLKELGIETHRTMPDTRAYR
ncbi:MAG: DNA recombination protein RmuC [Cyclobacteriaceae bacterium]|nr:MAG: DNA recombination protein RmuC [Cyclobacteriaceae bacterium]